MRAGATDARRLGVAIRRLRLDARAVALTDAVLSGGWHGVDADRGGPWRWTDGEATIETAGVREIAFELAMHGLYWIAPQPAVSRYASDRCASWRTWS
jgi:hypothetical protein